MRVGGGDGWGGWECGGKMETIVLEQQLKKTRVHFYLNPCTQSDSLKLYAVEMDRTIGKKLIIHLPVGDSYTSLLMSGRQKLSKV